MPRVYSRNSSYDLSVLRPCIFGLLESMDQGSIGRNCRVLIKPNLLAPAPPEKAIVTHPLIVRTVAEYVLDKGAVPQVSDSPAMGTFDRVMKESGIREALKDLPVECRPFRDSVSLDIGPPFNSIEIARDAAEADIVINLAKLKTHTQMLLTLCVKNMFGCIVGMRKPEWHFRTGVDREKFAELLVRIWAAVNPQINILDGILAMEGQGPGRGGVPREIGVIVAGSSGLDIDRAVCSMLGIHEDGLLTVSAAKRIGHAAEPLEIDGPLPEVHDLKLPAITPLVFGPGILHPFMRRHLVQRPVCNSSLCVHCGECWRYCPAKAIEPALEGLKFDYDKCIRCYCCVEVCPHGALSSEETRTGGFIRKILRQ